MKVFTQKIMMKVFTQNDEGFYSKNNDEGFYSKSYDFLSFATIGICTYQPDKPESGLRREYGLSRTTHQAGV